MDTYKVQLFCNLKLARLLTEVRVILTAAVWYVIWCHSSLCNNLDLGGALGLSSGTGPIMIYLNSDQAF